MSAKSNADPISVVVRTRSVDSMKGSKRQEGDTILGTCMLVRRIVSLSKEYFAGIKVDEDENSVTVLEVPTAHIHRHIV